jgi:hypothetical protein
MGCFDIFWTSLREVGIMKQGIVLATVSQKDHVLPIHDFGYQIGKSGGRSVVVRNPFGFYQNHQLGDRQTDTTLPCISPHIMSVQVTPAQMDSLKATLLNTSGSTPLHERFRALFMLKAVNNDEVVKIVSEGMSQSGRDAALLPLGGRTSLCRDVQTYRYANDTGLADPSPLLKHELAYVLGQLQNPLAISTLEDVLVNPRGQHCSMVRHEAAEALGALSAESSLPLLRKYMDQQNEASREVRETCEIAVGKIEFDHSEEGKARKQK